MVEALKVAEVAAAATVTEAGIVRAALVSANVTIAPPVGAAAVSLRVQVEVLELFNVVGTQDREERAGNAAEPVIVPPVAVTEMPFPELDEATALLIPIDVVGPAIVRFTIAMVPFAMVVAFIPETRQV